MECFYQSLWHDLRLLWEMSDFFASCRKSQQHVVSNFEELCIGLGESLISVTCLFYYFFKIVMVDLSEASMSSILKMSCYALCGQI